MKYNKNVHKSLMMITQFSVNMLVPIAICSLLGYAIDKSLGTKFVFIIMFFIGAIAGFRNIYILSKGIFDDADSKKRRKH